MNLMTSYMGLTLRNPLIASASPLTGELGALRALEDHGAAAVVLPSLFEEQLRVEQAEYDRGHYLPASGSAEAQTYFPIHGQPEGGAQGYLRRIQRAKEALDIPVIASLNCVSPECWRDYARQMQDAGADAVELNLGFGPADVNRSGRDVEESCVRIVAAVRAAVHIPIAAKIGPYFSSVGALARELADAGANGLVLFNRFYQPDIDVRTLQLSLEIELSSPWEARLPLLWTALLHGRISATLAVSTGVHSADDVYKFLLAGADAVMSTSALLRHGPEHMRKLVAGLEKLLGDRGLDSLEQVRGLMSAQQADSPIGQLRSNYVRMLLRPHIAPGS